VDTVFKEYIKESATRTKGLIQEILDWVDTTCPEDTAFREILLRVLKNQDELLEGITQAK
jgi:hypothetical protein